MIKDASTDEEFNQATKRIEAVVEQAKKYPVLDYETYLMQTNLLRFEEGKKSCILSFMVDILSFRTAIKEKLADQKELKSEESCNPQETNDGIQVFDTGGWKVFAPAGVNISVTKVII